MKEYFRPLILMLSGWSTIIMTFFVPIEGGGASMIFLISVPIQIAIGLLFGASYWYLNYKTEKEFVKNIVFYGMLFLLVGLCLLYYPYKKLI